MEKLVYIVEMKDYGELKKILAADPYARDSFAVAGYSLKDSKTVGLKGGSYVVFVKTADGALIPKLKERLKPLQSGKELVGDEKDKVVLAIEGEEDNAASGVGSIFG
ncbi:MAG: hypothetical protein ABH863_06205 [Candidatus Micrarchaeota archaeon]